ncbi:hypothetical protein GWI33_009395 [Rhynchophorus ferrugineus]|uniref:Cuticle protein n=1 Tax=Rhynchophorus ferrugineus TaxID=354439 RepID=A0A834MB31_RHYFE|nr:hypothetical protein GWI33_009395 [Rhynchophorus ferrugineus]
MYKVLAVAALLAAVSAAPADYQATSYVKFNDNHNAVSHVDSAPAAPAYAAPVAKVALPAVAKVAAPVYSVAPAVAKYAVAAAPVYSAAPAVAKYAVAAAPVYSAAPAVAKYAVAAAPVYSAAPAVAKYAVAAAPTVVKAAPVAYAAPVAKYAAAPAYQEESYEPIPYEFNYGIQDPHTGDFHSQEEKSDGHHVVGQYSLHEADGTIRIVKYSDDGHGFNAVVERQGEPTPAPHY